MADIATLWDAQRSYGDWVVDAPATFIWTDEKGNSLIDDAGQPVGADFTSGRGLVAARDLQTAALISLFSDAEASTDEVPVGAGDPRGWWAGPIGSKLWLRARSKATPTLPALVKDDIEQALGWMVTDAVVASITVTVGFIAPSAVGAQVVFRRQDGARAALRFDRLWESV